MSNSESTIVAFEITCELHNDSKVEGPIKAVDIYFMPT